MALTDDLDHAGLPEPKSPTLVKRNGARPSGAVRNAPDTGVAPSLVTLNT
jgi:hypothetical protein